MVRPLAMTTRDEMVREFFLGFIKIHVLHHAAEEEVYGLALIVELRRHGYELSPGSIYPVLHRLERAAYLRRIDRVINGKVRKYYTITRRGAAALADTRKKIAELVGEVLAPDVTTPRMTSGPTRQSSATMRRAGHRERVKRKSLRGVE
ncbi:MAG: PadR family transcriptional regulator [Candidatus Rokuibacteriota bacterium]